MAASPAQLLIVALLVLMLFGARRIPELGKGLGNGLRSFREGLSGDDSEDDPSPRKKLSPKAEPDPTSDA